MDLFSGSFKSGKIAERKSTIKIWVLRCSCSGRVHYLEAYKEFVDVLLSFLMLRTGALIKLNREILSKRKQVKASAAICGLYDSFNSLDDSVVIVDKEILLDPFQKIRVSEELQSLNKGDFECCNEDCFKHLAGSRKVCQNCTISTHFSCNVCGGYFQENAHTSLCYTPWRPWRNHMTAAPTLTRYTVIQNKSPATSNDLKNDGFVKTNIPFIITNDLEISPFSTSTVAEALKNCGAGSCEDLECNELSIGTSEVLMMVGAALTSPTPLTDIFGNMCNKKTRVCPSRASFPQSPSYGKTPTSNNIDQSLIMRQCLLTKGSKDPQEQAPKPLPTWQVQHQSVMGNLLKDNESPPLFTTNQLVEEIPKSTSTQQQCVAEGALEPQVDSILGTCSSCRQEQIEPQVAKEFTQTETQTQSSYKQPEKSSTLQSLQQQLISTIATLYIQPRANKSPSVGVSNYANSLKEPNFNATALESQPLASESSFIKVLDTDILSQEPEPAFVQQNFGERLKVQELGETQCIFDKHFDQNKHILDKQKPAQHIEETRSIQQQKSKQKAQVLDHQKPTQRIDKAPSIQQQKLKQKAQVLDHQKQAQRIDEAPSIQQQKLKQKEHILDHQKLAQRIEKTPSIQQVEQNEQRVDHQKPAQRIGEISSVQQQTLEENEHLLDQQKPSINLPMHESLISPTLVLNPITPKKLVQRKKILQKRAEKSLTASLHSMHGEPQVFVPGQEAFHKKTRKRCKPKESALCQKVQDLPIVSEKQSIQQADKQLNMLIEQLPNQQRQNSSTLRNQQASYEHALLSRTPYSETLFHHFSQVPSRDPTPSLVLSNLQSIANPLYQQETCQSNVPSSRPSKLPTPPTFPQKMVDTFVPPARHRPQMTSCVAHSITQAPSIVRRSYPLAKCQPKIKDRHPKVRFSDNCVSQEVRPFPSISRAFEQGFPKDLEWSEVHSSASDTSDRCSFYT